MYAAHASRSPPFKDNRSPKTIPFKTSEKVRCFKKLNSGVRGKKITDHWHIPKIEKNIAWMGTSNLRRITKIDRDDVQVISYSGMKLQQFLRLIDEFAFGKGSKNPGMQPSHIVAMGGINDMDLSKQTNKTSISNIHSALKRQFPNSKISFCQVPMDEPKFSPNQVETIRQLNEDIAYYCKNHSINCIPTLPKEDFEVDPADYIHWTPDCANKTFKHVMKHLN